jgi:hypothetical protein
MNIAIKKILNIVRVGIMLFCVNIYGQSTINLADHVEDSAPVGAILEWHNGLPPSSSNLMTAAQIAAAPAGVYYAIYHDISNNCYSPYNQFTVATNICPATTVDLSQHVANPPVGTTVVWFDNAAHSGTAYATPTMATAGTYYAFYYDALNNCYSPASAPVAVVIGTCSSVIANNICPATTVDLSQHVSNPPVGTTVVWFDNAAHSGTAYATPTMATAGTYYAFYYDALNNCYSPASASVEVVIGTCSSVIANNVCPATTVDLSQHVSNPPVGTTVVWFDNAAHSGTAYATPTMATAGTYYAFYYDALNNCYSPASASVEVVITICCPVVKCMPIQVVKQ